MVFKSIFLVTYKDHDSIEGYLENLTDFDLWLFQHNKRRKEDDNLAEYGNEFDIKEVRRLLE